MPRRPTPSRLSPQLRLFRRLLATMGMIRRVMDPFFAQHGLSGAQWAVLRVMVRAADEGVVELTSGELSSRLILRPPSLTGLLDRLQRRGLIARRTSDADRRIKLVRLTPDGRALMDRVLQLHHHQIAKLFAGLPRNEQRQLDRLLRSLDIHLEQLIAEQEGSQPSFDTEL